MSINENIYMKMIKESRYFMTILHSNQCEICKLSEEFKIKINSMIFRDVKPVLIQSELIRYYPEKFTKNADKILEYHQQYIKCLIEDLNIRKMFKHLSHKIKSINKLNSTDKAILINEIELELKKDNDICDFNDHLITMKNNLFKETLPLSLARLNYELIHGITDNIKNITNSVNTLWKMMNNIQIVDNIENGIEDFDKVSQDKIVSLADKIKEATKKTIPEETEETEEEKKG
jgi:hypothetical protein